MDNKPICKNCEHSRPFMFTSYELAKCKAPQSFTKYSLLTGETTQEWDYCAVYRSKGDDMCGPEGRWFEEKKPLWFRLLRRLTF